MEDENVKVHQFEENVTYPPKFLLLFTNIKPCKSFLCCDLEVGVTVISFLKLILACSFISFSIEELSFTIIEIFVAFSYVIFLRGRYMSNTKNITQANNMFSVMFYIELFNMLLSIIFINQIEDDLHIVTKSKRNQFYQAYVSTVFIVLVADLFIYWAFYSYYFYLENKLNYQDRLVSEEKINLIGINNNITNDDRLDKTYNTL